jgi:hypothetical protein
VFTDSEQATYRMETVEPTYEHFLPKSRSVLNKNEVNSIEKVEDEMSISSTEDHRQQMESHLGRCVKRHQALLE